MHTFLFLLLPCIYSPYTQLEHNIGVSVKFYFILNDEAGDLGNFIRLRICTSASAQEDTNTFKTSENARPIIQLSCPLKFLSSLIKHILQHYNNNNKEKHT